MKNTTLCYLERDGKYLMLHRTKKENDPNEGKWLGIGGKFEDGESPEECARREILEETGLSAGMLRWRGIVTFVSDLWETEYMHLFTCRDFTGNIIDCDEGELRWVDKKALSSLPMWEGDKVFFKLISAGHPFFSLKLTYKGEKLLNAELDGKKII